MPFEYLSAEDPRFVDRYRLASQEIATPVAVVTTGSGTRLRAITVDSFLDVSWDPPTMAVSVYSGSRMMEALETNDAMALHVLAEGQKGIAQWLGEPGQPNYGVFDRVPTESTPEGNTMISGALVSLELRIVSRLEVATHTLVVGEVMGLLENTERPAPMIRFADRYGTFALSQG